MQTLVGINQTQCMCKLSPFVSILETFHIVTLLAYDESHTHKLAHCNSYPQQLIQSDKIISLYQHLASYKL